MRAAATGPRFSVTNVSIASTDGCAITTTRRVMRSSSVRSPRRSRTHSSIPQSLGTGMPCGRAGMNNEVAACARPAKLSGAQLAIPTVPPVRATRNNSAAAAAGRGANIAPKHETTRSNAPAAKGSASASASIHCTPRPCVRARPISTIRGVRSDAVTTAPRCAAAIAALPVPAPTSSRRSPARVPTAVTRSADAGVTSAVSLLRSPWLHMNFCSSLSGVTSIVVSMPAILGEIAPATTGSTLGLRRVERPQRVGQSLPGSALGARRRGRSCRCHPSHPLAGRAQGKWTDSVRPAKINLVVPARRNCVRDGPG